MLEVKSGDDPWYIFLSNHLIGFSQAKNQTSYNKSVIFIFSHVLCSEIVSVFRQKITWKYNIEIFFIASILSSFRSQAFAKHFRSKKGWLKSIDVSLLLTVIG